MKDTICYGHCIAWTLSQHQSSTVISSSWLRWWRTEAEKITHITIDNWSFPRYIWSLTGSIYQGKIDWQCSVSLSNLGQIKTLNRKIVALRQFLTENQFPRNINNFNLNPQYQVSLAYYHTILALGNVRKFPIIIGHQNDFNVFLWCLGCYEDNLDQPYGL